MIPANATHRQHAIQLARQVLERRPIYLDTETTGLDRSAEIVEISIVDDDGNVLLDSFVKPSQPIPADATRIHGITQEMVARAPSWPALWPTVRGILLGKVLAIYNADFDMRMMQQSLTRYRLTWKDNFQTFDIVKLYAEFRGDWDMQRRSYRYFSLDAAGKACGIELPNAHRATADTLLARALVHYIAEAQN